MGKGETLNSWEVKQLEAGFNVLDLNKDGKIEFSELKIALSACGFDYNEEEIADMIRVVDKSKKRKPFFFLIVQDFFFRLDRNPSKLESTSLDCPHFSLFLQMAVSQKLNSKGYFPTNIQIKSKKKLKKHSNI